MSDSPVHIVTGGAGFVGSNLVRELCGTGARVLALDDFSLGRRAYLDGIDGVTCLEVDVADIATVDRVLGDLGQDAVEVWHLCANSDIQKGSADPSVDLRSTFLSTFAVLDVMRRRGWKTLHFASTSAVYGDHGGVAIDELAVTEPISNYGAMKLASEAIIRAACELFLERASIFRFPNVVGLPATHGVILDFTRRLLAKPSCLTVLGNGTQQKTYLHVSDLVSAMRFIAGSDLPGCTVFNVGPDDDGVRVNTIAELVRMAVAPGATIAYGGEDRGWVGDVPRFRYDIAKLRMHGWAPQLDSEAAVARAVNETAQQEGAMVWRAGPSNVTRAPELAS